MTERELIQGCINKDIRCQRMLFDKYAGVLMTICRRYSRNHEEAEDMLQESFIRAFSYISQYKYKGAFEGWLKRITVNSALRVLQIKKIFFLEINETVEITHPIDADAISNLNEEELLELIGKLPDGYRTIFNLYAIEGYDHEEIASLLNIKPSTSRSQLSKARKLLQEQIESFEKLPIKYAK